MCSFTMRTLDAMWVFRAVESCAEVGVEFAERVLFVCLQKLRVVWDLCVCVCLSVIVRGGARVWLAWAKLLLYDGRYYFGFYSCCCGVE